MKFNSLIKYALRFIFLQGVLTSFISFYFDNFLISNQDFKQGIYLNLVEDTTRFIPSLNTELITIDAFFSVMIFAFLIILYSTKFYTYVNELSYSINKNLLDEYFQLYLLWTSYLFAMFFIFRFENVSRGYLFILSFLIPLMLLVMRNTEFLSSLLGRSVTNETFLSINLEKNSNFRNLRIITFRKPLGDLQRKDLDKSDGLIDEIDKINKVKKINLIVINLEDKKRIKLDLERYLINTNKKILLISENKPVFKTSFIYRQENIDGIYFTYFNNDIQYGAKYILKRILDIFLIFVWIGYLFTNHDPAFYIYCSY